MKLVTAIIFLGINAVVNTAPMVKCDMQVPWPSAALWLCVCCLWCYSYMLVVSYAHGTLEHSPTGAQQSANCAMRATSGDCPVRPSSFRQCLVTFGLVLPCRSKIRFADWSVGLPSLLQVWGCWAQAQVTCLCFNALDGLPGPCIEGFMDRCNLDVARGPPQFLKKTAENAGANLGRAIHGPMPV